MSSLGEADWHEALAAHPRLGGKGRGDAEKMSAWSKGEQAGATSAPAAERAALAEANAAYERRFGHVFLLCATGLNARAMLDALARRVGNEPAEELAIAAAEQRKITRLRLAKLAAAPNDDGAIPPS
jgi:OHCU decarboxylase